MIKNTTKNYFSEAELSCPCCGENKFKPETLQRFNNLREELGSGITMTSGYRCEAYNTAMGFTQTHATGQAGDLLASHQKAFNLVRLAYKHKFTGIGIKQNGSNRFVHLDDLPVIIGRPRPHIWSY